MVMELCDVAGKHLPIRASIFPFCVVYLQKRDDDAQVSEANVISNSRVSNTPGNPGKLLKIYQVSWEFSG